MPASLSIPDCLSTNARAVKRIRVQSRAARKLGWAGKSFGDAALREHQFVLIAVLRRQAEVLPTQ